MWILLEKQHDKPQPETVPSCALLPRLPVAALNYPDLQDPTLDNGANNPHKLMGRLDVMPPLKGFVPPKTSQRVQVEKRILGEGGNSAWTTIVCGASSVGASVQDGWDQPQSPSPGWGAWLSFPGSPRPARMPAPSLLAPILQNLPGVERLSPKNRAWAPLRLFSPFPVIYHHQLRVPRTASPPWLPRDCWDGDMRNQHVSGVCQGSGIRGQSGGVVGAQQGTRTMA